MVKANSDFGGRVRDRRRSRERPEYRLGRQWRRRCGEWDSPTTRRL